MWIVNLSLPPLQLKCQGRPRRIERCQSQQFFGGGVAAQSSSKPKSR
ncbi:hypothetical protein PPTG_19783 [Phytophthora nicotianae INRA-310]|uniref:Uncharacterized protein n=1 Tax=Phytophthora nicotianae (strain INRA-310) TaxID=761204 RepID=W2PBW1_PHYN3|nr:hypothetical protein PPTG_19783 [Phytophthora nicotianae INRA-310]ETM98150.1 hypothetical protein PPTG_19783 [Phytophthora nicotianae INRA-310]